MKRRVLLFNFEEKYEKKKAKEFLSIMPEAEIKPYGLIGISSKNRSEEKSMISLWVPEELFMSAWTYFNVSELSKEETTFEDGLEYFELNRKDPELIENY